MAFSTQRATSDGTLVYLALSIDYIDREDIQVFLDDVLPPVGSWEWDGTNSAIRFLSGGVPTPLPNGTEVLVTRTTDLAEVLHVFSAQAGGGGSAKFTNGTMDENFKQLLLIGQEAKEGSSLTDMFSNLNMHGYKLTNVGPGDVNAPGDLPNMGQIFTISGMAGTYANQAEVSKNQAQAAQVAAQTAANTAASDAANAVDALIQPMVDDAEAARDASIVARNAAQTARTGAETARTGAQTAQTAAETARTGAETARTGAETALTGAETARTQAQTAQTAASGSATAAQAWAIKMDGPVEGSEYSSKYNALRAESAADDAEGWAASVNSEELSTDSAGPTAPLVTFPYMRWADTSFNPAVLRIRNADNTAWVEIGPVLRPLGTASALDVTTSALDTTANRALKTGDYGLGVLQPDAHIDPGFPLKVDGLPFSLRVWSGFENPGGAPDSPYRNGYGTALHLPRSSDRGSILAIDDLTSVPGMFLATLRSTTPTDWAEMFHTLNCTLVSNANGISYRFPNGLQICVSAAVTVASSGITHIEHAQTFSEVFIALTGQVSWGQSLPFNVKLEAVPGNTSLQVSAWSLGTTPPTRISIATRALTIGRYFQ